MRISDWSSDVCSSDLTIDEAGLAAQLCNSAFAAGHGSSVRQLDRRGSASQRLPRPSQLFGFMGSFRVSFRLKRLGFLILHLQIETTRQRPFIIATLKSARIR